MTPLPLIVLGLAQGDKLIQAGAYCQMHASWRDETSLKLKSGQRLFLVRDPALVRRVLKNAAGVCCECAERSGAVLERDELDAPMSASDAERSGGDA